MIFDIAVAVILIGGIKAGYTQGFLRSLLAMIGYIAGAIAGLYFALEYNKSAWVIVAIFIGAGIGSFAGKMLAKALKITIVRGPLEWLDSTIGALFQAIAILIVAFFVGTALLWAPWTAGQNEVSKSKIYLQLNSYMPNILSHSFSTLMEKFEK